MIYNSIIAQYFLIANQGIHNINNLYWILKLLCGIVWYCKGVVIMSTLQDLWYGNIRPNEDKVITDEEKKLIELIARHHETLSSSLKNEDLIVFEKYVDCSQSTLR